MDITFKVLFAAMIILGMFLGGALASAVFCLIMRKRANVPWADNSRSHCDSCGRTLTFVDLIPVISYIALRGKCRTCKAKIPANGFRVELGWSLCTGVLTAAAIQWYDHVVTIVLVAILAIAAALTVLYIETRETTDGK